MATNSFPDRSIPGGIVHNPATPFAREMAKWEMAYSPYGPPGRPREVVGFQQWPAMFYKCKRSDSNGDFVVEHYREAADENEARTLEGLGYSLGRAAAEQAVVAREQMVAQAAAERAFTDRRMSEKAQAEAKAADEATAEHVAEVPVTPIRRRGRPAKVAAE